jgi:hypothetical protein
MADYLEQGRSLVEKIRTLVGTLRNSPAEIVTAALAAVCFSAAALVLGNEAVKAFVPFRLEILRDALYAIGALLVAWTVFRIWKQAIPPALPEPETRPSGNPNFGKRTRSARDELGRPPDLSPRPEPCSEIMLRCRWLLASFRGPGPTLSPKAENPPGVLPFS